MITRRKLLVVLLTTLLCVLNAWAVTVDVSVTASADDGDEGSTGTADIVNTALLNVDGTGEWNFFRFTGISAAAGATCTAAYLTLDFETGALDEPDVTIYAQDSATIAAVSTSGNPNMNISARPRTTMSVNWGNTNLGAPGSFNTADLCGPVQEIFDSYGPYVSEDMGFMFTSRANDGTRDTSVTAWDHTTRAAPALHLEFTEPGGVRRVIVISGN